MKRKVTKDEAQNALEVLAAFGRQRFIKGAKPSRGTCVGAGVSSIIGDVGGVVDAAVEMLEDLNFHLSVALIQAVERGQGTVTRQGRNVKVVLPEHWS